jgi:hypothetical protein
MPDAATPPGGDVDLSLGRLRALARLAAYALQLLFLISVVTSLLPWPAADGQRWLALLSELIERSTLPLVASVLLLAGLSGAVVPARWELAPIHRQRGLLRLAAGLYFVTALALLPLAHQLSEQRGQTIQSQLSQSASQLKALQQQVTGSDSLDSLLRLVPTAEQRQELEKAGDVEAARALLLQRLKNEAALQQRRGLSALAEAQGAVWKNAMRLTLSALVYVLYFLLASLAWPARWPQLIERIRQHQQQAEDDKDPES